MATTEGTHTEMGPRDPALVVFIQYLLPVSFTVAMLGIIAWIVSLILLSRKLDDVVSASMGISIVAIPVFIVLLSIFWYVFLGIIRNQDGEPAAPSPTGEPAHGAGNEEQNPEGGGQ